VEEILIEELFCYMKVEVIKMPIINQDYWDNQVEINKDEYSKCCVDIAREVMRLLDTPEYQSFDCHKIICDAEKNVEESGITGFMAGAIASIVNSCHSRGEEFRKKWNLGYSVTEDMAKGGTVNPALITIET